MFTHTYKSTHLWSLMRFVEAEGRGIPDRCVRIDGMWYFSYL